MVMDKINENTEQSGELLLKAKKRAMYLLGARAYSRGELLKKLSETYPPEICEVALEWVTDCGYLNDSDYAEKLAKKLIQVKRYGPRKVRWEMKQKYISDEIIEEVLASYGNEDIRAEITELINRKYRDNLDERKDIERVINALARRGYDFDDIKSCISEVQEDIEVEYD